MHLHSSWLLTAISSAPSEQIVDATERSVIFVIAATILGLIVVLLILLQMTAIRRRSSASRNQRDETPVTSIDPWVESARRMSADEPQDDQS